MIANMRAIQTITVGSTPTNSISFTSIPQTYTDLMVKYSLRATSNSSRMNINIRLNASSSGYVSQYFSGANGGGGAAQNATGTSNIYAGEVPAANATASSFSSAELYIPNYRSSNAKETIVYNAQEQNSTSDVFTSMISGTSSVTAAVTQIDIFTGADNLAQFSSATLYGIYNPAAAGAKATGGAIFYDDTNVWHVFYASGIFAPTQSLSADVITIAGGGGGGKAGGGGGAGSLIHNANLSLSATNYVVTIGGGGSGATTRNNVPAPSGSASAFSSTSATGGGGGCSNNNATGAGGAGGSGGGAVNAGAGGTASAGTLNGGTGYVNIGGGGVVGGNQGQGGGGSGAPGGVQSGFAGGSGGNGTTAFSSWGVATLTGQLSGSTYYYAGGGAGYSDLINPGGLGGGGNSSIAGFNGTSGTANTGGGGGGSRDDGSGTGNGGAGGSGLVIVRYAR